MGVTTLGSLMGIKKSESRVAATAYIPGYPEQDIEDEPALPRDPTQNPLEALTDLSLDAKKALVDG